MDHVTDVDWTQIWLIPSSLHVQVILAFLCLPYTPCRTWVCVHLPAVASAWTEVVRSGSEACRETRSLVAT